LKRALGVGLSVVLVIVVAVVVAINVFRGAGSGDTQAGCDKVTTVHGVVGSEKVDFFNSPAVKQAFKTKCLVVEVEPAGSREIATNVDLSKYDFAFPASTPSAEKIRQAKKVSQVYTPFSSPMAVATFAPLVQVLTQAGVVSKQASGSYVLDMAKYLDLVKKGTRWDALPGNTAYKVRKNVLVTTTDPRDSNSAAMYLAIVAYVANGDTIVQNSADEQKVLPALVQAFLPQGGSADTSAVPFDDYLSFGMGKTPMVLIYESQFVQAAVRHDSRLTPDHVLLYPSPTIFSKHTLVPFNANGSKVGQLLTADPTLTDAAAKAGFRTADPGKFRATVQGLKIPVAVDLNNVIEPPQYRILEGLLNAVGKEYDQ
jgi:hypothetical protein